VQGKDPSFSEAEFQSEKNFPPIFHLTLGINLLTPFAFRLFEQTKASF
jgi:hypothetical protein